MTAAILGYSRNYLTGTDGKWESLSASMIEDAVGDGVNGDDDIPREGDGWPGSLKGQLWERLAEIEVRA